MRLLELGPGPDAQLVDQHLPPVLEDLQRLRPPPTAVQREHRMRPQLFVERVRPGWRGEFAPQGGVPAEPEPYLDVLALGPAPGALQQGRTGSGAAPGRDGGRSGTGAGAEPAGPS